MTSCVRQPSRVVVINDASVAKGGATGLAIASIRWFRERDVPVTMIVGDGGANPELVALGVEIVAACGQALTVAPPVTSLVNGLYNRRAETIIGAWIAANDGPGVVYHLHGWSKILSPSVFAALGPVRRRVVVSAHDFFLVCPNGGFTVFPKNEACRRVPLGGDCLTTNCDKRNYAQKTWRVARQAVANYLRHRHMRDVPIVAIHEGMVPLLTLGGLAERNIVVLRNPVVPFRTDRVRAEHNRKAVFIGRLDHEKGPDLAAAAAADAGAPLQIIGDGPLRAQIAQAHPDVEFAGWRTREDIGRLVGDARLLLMTSRYPEPFGLVLIEALWSGLPVVVARDALLAEEIIRLGVGASVNPFETSEFGATLATLMADDEAVARMSRKAFGDIPRIASDPASWTAGLLELYRTRLGE
ncbi:Glycosyl transferase family 1 domain-containing protein [Methylorubrum aminovorans]